MSVLSKIKGRWAHPIYLDILHRARCDGCGWVGPVRFHRYEADRAAHWKNLGV